VTEARTNSSPFGVSWTSDEFNLLEGFVDVELELSLWNNITVQGEAGENTNDCGD
jgi:hypothetical protein